MYLTECTVIQQRRRLLTGRQGTTWLGLGWVGLFTCGLILFDDSTWFLDPRRRVVRIPHAQICCCVCARQAKANERECEKAKQIKRRSDRILVGYAKEGALVRNEEERDPGVFSSGFFVRIGLIGWMGWATFDRPGCAWRERRGIIGRISLIRRR